MSERDKDELDRHLDDIKAVVSEGKKYFAKGLRYNVGHSFVDMIQAMGDEKYAMVSQIATANIDFFTLHIFKPDHEQKFNRENNRYFQRDYMGYKIGIQYLRRLEEEYRTVVQLCARIIADEPGIGDSIEDSLEYSIEDSFGDSVED